MAESPQCDAPQKRALLLVHSDSSDAGRVGTALEARGFALDIRNAQKGDSLPKGMEAHDIAVIFGGPMSANDEIDFIRRELQWTEQALKDEKPLLGICLGGQIMARVLGGSVDFHHNHKVEAGFYPIRPTPEGRQLFPSKLHVYEWHQEGFSMPKDATLLAGSANFPHQAFSYGRSAYGLQFHPELTMPIMRRWIRRGQKRLSTPGARQKLRHFIGYPLYDPALNRWLKRFLDQFFLKTLTK